MVVVYIQKDGGDETGPALCHLMENPDLVYQETGDPQTIHSQLNVIADKLSRLGQTIQTEWSLNQEVFKQCAPDGTNRKWTCLSPGSTSYISLSHRFQIPRPGQWTPSVYLGGGGGSGTICLSNGNHLGQVVEKLQDYPCNSHPDCTRVAQHALVLGPGEHV